MSKKSRKIKRDLDSSPFTPKRVAKKPRNTTKASSECILWPAEEEESFFSNSKLGNLLTSHEPELFASRNDTTIRENTPEKSFFSVTKLESLFSSQNSSRIKGNDINISRNCSVSFNEENLFSTANLCNFLSQDVSSVKCDPEESRRSLSATQGSRTAFQEVNDDSIFSDINLPCTADRKAEISMHQLSMESNNTLFTEIHLEDLTRKETEDLFENEIINRDAGEQNTQRFLDDVALKMPVVGCNQKPAPEEGPGAQYETRKEIVNRTMLLNLTHLDWETQAFAGLEAEEDFPCLGNFYGLPETVKRLIFEHKGIKSLYEWQDECLNLPAIRKRKNLIYALPTSGGKTLVAEILMLREIICRQKNVLFVLPYVSIVQEKVSAMSPFAIALDFIVDEYTAGKGKCPPAPRKKRKSIFIASIEKGAVLINSLIEAQRANEIGLVVVDELHLIGEKGRGATLEALLTKIMFLNAHIQIVGMSATIGNITEISAFLKADVYTRSFRPVELREYIKCGNDILQINANGKTLEEVFVYERSLNFKYSEEVARADPDHLAGLVSECAPSNSCLIFCPTRKNCENVAVLLTRILPKSKFLEHRRKEKADLMDALDKICGILSSILAKTIPYGVAYHHSGLTTDERKFIETAYRFGVLSVICCTSTLAAGVNLPAKRVIIRAPYVGSEFMTLCKYKQMVGRAGRAGMGEAGESFLITSSRDNVRVGEMLFSPMDKAVSSLHQQDGVGLQGLILSAIGLGLAACRSDLYSLIGSTLLAVQATELEISIKDIILQILREMFTNKVLEVHASDKRNCTAILTTQNDVQNSTYISSASKSFNSLNLTNVSKKATVSHASKNTSTVQDRRIFVSKSTRFQLTTIGKAAFKAGIDYKRAYAIHTELKASQQHLILASYAHLLYLVVAFNSNANGDELFAADAAILFRLYTTLDETTQQLFKVLNFTEAHAAKMAKTLSIQGPMQLKLNRLFKVLILQDILCVMPLPTVAAKYGIERGMLQNLVSQSTAAASALVRLCEQVEEFWCFKPLFERVSAKMDRCGTMELLELPAVKLNRAKQLYTAGYKTIGDIAKCRPMQLVNAVEHMPLRIAKEIISAAKIILMKKLDHLEEETEVLKQCLNTIAEEQQTQ